MSVQSPVRALLFDVFGTCVDWRSTVTRELHDAMHKSLNAADHSIASRVRLACDSMSDEKWAEFAQKWRNTYKRFTRGLASDASIPWKSVDDHHYDSLLQLIEEYHLSTLWDPEEVRRLSLVWHHLDPWQDSSEGIGAISQICSTATLSNGNLSLLSDLKTHANMPFTHIFSAEMFGSYKPSSKVYLGAAEKLSLSPGECAMVAAHLDDLKAAKDLGFRAIYVQRPLEEDWEESKVEGAKTAGWVDIWVNEDEMGFLTVAEKLIRKQE